MTQDIYNRDLESYWKTAVFNRFGGYMWFNILSAIGHVPQSIVKIVNELIEPKITTAGPRISATARAKAQGQQVPARGWGVQHQTSEPKRLREAAQLITKRMDAAAQRWWDAERWGRSTVQAERKN